METKEYIVARQHYGDKEYVEGDTRTLTTVDGERLKKLGLVRDKTAGLKEPAKAKTATAAAAKVKKPAEDK